MRRVPWVALAALLGAAGIWLAAFLQPLLHLVPGCVFKRLTGFACLSCGLTRCVLAMGQGHWREAFHWHPAVAGGVVLLPLLALWDLRRAWCGDPYPSLPASRVARLSVWALLLALWALQVVRGI